MGKYYVIQVNYNEDSYEYEFGKIDEIIFIKAETTVELGEIMGDKEFLIRNTHLHITKTFTDVYNMIKLGNDECYALYKKADETRENVFEAEDNKLTPLIYEMLTTENMMERLSVNIKLLQQSTE